MNKQQLWKIYTDKNPSFAGDGEITLTAAGLRKLFDTTFEQGIEHGRQLSAIEAAFKETLSKGKPFFSR